MAPGADGMLPPPHLAKTLSPPPNGDSTDPKLLGGIHTIYAWVAVGPQMGPHPPHPMENPTLPPKWDATDPKPLGGILTIYAWVAVGPKW